MILNRTALYVQKPLKSCQNWSKSKPLQCFWSQMSSDIYARKVSIKKFLEKLWETYVSKTSRKKSLCNQKLLKKPLKLVQANKHSLKLVQGNFKKILWNFFKQNIDKEMSGNLCKQKILKEILKNLCGKNIVFCAKVLWRLNKLVEFMPLQLGF